MGMNGAVQANVDPRGVDAGSSQASSIAPAGYGSTLLRWLRHAEWPGPGAPWPRRRSLSAVDLFCGCGGLTMGAWEACRLSNLSLDIKLALDTNCQALEVFRRNFHCGARVARQGNVEALFSGELGAPCTREEECVKEQVGSVDVLVAGPPCQGHSDLNNSTRRDDPRNGLYLRTVRAAEILRPVAVLIENVPTVVHDRSGVVQRARRALAAANYCVSEAHVDFSALGVPQRRRRHVLTAVKRGSFDVAKFAASLCAVEIPLAPYIAGLEEEPNTRTGIFYQAANMRKENRARLQYLFEHNLYELPDHLRPPCHRDKPHTYASVYGRLRPDGPAQTITSGFGCMGQGRYVHPTEQRTLTAHEAARIQGFPDFFDFSPARTFKALRTMIANAVPPQLAAAIVLEWLHCNVVGDGHCIS